MFIFPGVLSASAGAGSGGVSFVTGSVTTLTYYDAAYAPLTNGSYFAFGQSSTGTSTATYVYSVDGVSWSNGTLPASASWYTTAASASRIVAFRSNATTAYYSDNGTTWTITNALHGSNSLSPVSALWDGTQFVIGDSGAGGTGTLRYSTDGITWSGTSAFATDTSSRVGFDGVSRYIATSSLSQTNVYTTITFPTGWTATTLPAAAAHGEPIYGNGIWLILRPGSASYSTSTTGTGSWTTRTLPSLISESSSERSAKFVFTGGKFYYYYVDNIYSSADGITWATDKTVTGDTLDQVTGWAVSATKVIGVGQASASTGSGVYLNGSK